MLEKLTVIIPTYNRINFIKRSHSYWKKTQVNFLICDSSDKINDDFKSIGFDISIEKDLMIVKSVPYGIEKSDVEEVVENMLSEDFNISNDLSISDFFAKRLSKITSIKSGQKLNLDEQEYIVNHLFSCKEPNLSPDNKQIFITLSKNDIENKFNG